MAQGGMELRVASGRLAVLPTAYPRKEVVPRISQRLQVWRALRGKGTCSVADGSSHHAARTPQSGHPRPDAPRPHIFDGDLLPGFIPL